MTDMILGNYRLFFGVSIPEVLREELCLISKKWLSNFRKLKYVEIENIHVTLKFLGSVKENIIIKMDEVVKTFINEVKPFQISLEKEKILSGKVACFQVERGKDKLGEIYNFLNNEFVKSGVIADTRKYFPHVTLARLKSSGKPNKIDFDKYEFNCKSIILYRSILNEKGPIYKNIGEYYLKGEKNGKTVK